MSDDPRATEHRLQDYLDGRLSPEERTAFEARLEREAALRAELASALEVRAALGQGRLELSPGFYTRARARFQESTRGEKRWSFRLLSWETAGVAAAAALATALFVPRLMQPSDLGAVAAEQIRGPSLDRDRGREAARAPDRVKTPVLAEKEALASESTEQKSRAPAPAEERSRVSAPAEEQPTPQKSKKNELSLADVPEQPARKPTDSSDAERGWREVRDEAGALEPAEGEAGRARSPVVAREKREDDSFQATESEERGKRGAGATKGSRPTRTRPVVVELPTGLVEPGAVRSVERLAEWIELLDGEAGEALAMLESPAPNRRLVLIGARTGLACDSLVLADEADAYRIRPASSSVARKSVGGCALVLPLDGRSVSVAGPRQEAGP